MLEISRKWIEIGKILAKDPGKEVLCPKCENDFLKVEDQAIEGWDRVDRVLRCPNCGAESVVTLKP